MKPPLVVLVLALLRGLLADPAPGAIRLAMAAAPIVVPATTRKTIILDAGRAIDPVEVDGLGSLPFGGGPASVRHLDHHDHHRVVLVMRTIMFVHGGLDTRRPVRNVIAVGGSREVLLKVDLVGFSPEESVVSGSILSRCMACRMLSNKRTRTFDSD